MTIEKERIQIVEQLNGEYVKAFESGNFVAALFNLDQVAQICPRNQKNHILRATLYAYQGGFDQCRKIVDESLDDCKESDDVKYITAVLEYYQDNFEKAAELLNLILSSSPEHEQSKNCLKLLSSIKEKKEAGNGLFKEEKFEEALSMYTEALQIDKFHAKL